MLPLPALGEPSWANGLSPAFTLPGWGKRQAPLAGAPWTRPLGGAGSSPHLLLYPRLPGHLCTRLRVAPAQSLAASRAPLFLGFPPAWNLEWGQLPRPSVPKPTGSAFTASRIQHLLLPPSPSLLQGPACTPVSTLPQPSHLGEPPEAKPLSCSAQDPAKAWVPRGVLTRPGRLPRPTLSSLLKPLLLLLPVSLLSVHNPRAFALLFPLLDVGYSKSWLLHHLLLKEAPSAALHPPLKLSISLLPIPSFQ